MKEKEVMQLAKDYSYGAFNYFHEQLSKEFCNIQPYLKIRRNFWTKVKIGKYNFEEAKPILEEFSSILETEIERIVSRKSFVYWLHVYRRIFPGKINSSTTPLEILNTRRIMEISFQKYGKEALCSHINKLSVVSAKKVFNGLYTNPKFYKEYEGLLNSKDILVLTDFGVKELKEIYDLEKLCLELHYINKTYRILGKGGYLDFHEINRDCENLSVNSKHSRSVIK